MELEWRRRRVALRSARGQARDPGPQVASSGEVVMEQIPVGDGTAEITAKAIHFFVPGTPLVGATGAEGNRYPIVRRDGGLT